MAESVPDLNADVFTTIVSFLATSDKFTCAQVCSWLRPICKDSYQNSYAVVEHGSNITGAGLLRIMRKKSMRVSMVDVSDCKELTKADICRAVAAAPHVVELFALRVGPGSWSAKHLQKLFASVPRDLAFVHVDVLLEMKNDLFEGSTMLAALGLYGAQSPAQPPTPSMYGAPPGPVMTLRVEKLTLISDNVTAAATERPEAAAAAAPDDVANGVAAIDIADAAADDEGAEEGEDTYAAPPSEGLRALCTALVGQNHGRSPVVEHLRELDASSGALAVPGAASALLVPMLTAHKCALTRLAVCHLTRAGARALATAIPRNRSLERLNLNSNMIYGQTTSRLASSLDGHPTLTRLDLDYNPILDGGGVAIAKVLPSTRIAALSLAFTGVADQTCVSLANALGTDDCALRKVNLSGNSITTTGATAIAGTLGKLRALDLAANVAMDAEGSVAIAKALPTSSLRSLRLAGCKVDKRACGRLAASLLGSSLTSLDLSANHFGSKGSDELAFLLGEAEALMELDLSDCALEDEAGDELAEALAESSSNDRPLKRLDLRWNKLGEGHQGGRGLSVDPRVDATSQKQQTAADRQTAYLEKTFQQSKAAGKKVYVPKWQRDAKKSGKSGGTGAAIG